MSTCEHCKKNVEALFEIPSIYGDPITNKKKVCKECLDKFLEALAKKQTEKEDKESPSMLNYKEECKRLTAENAKLLCIHDGIKDELLMLRTIKATVECIFGRKIDIGE